MIKSLFTGFLLLGALFAGGANAQTQQETDDKLLNEYFKKNKIKATQTKTGMYYVISKKGTGENLKPGQKVSMRYLGTLLDGTRFDGNIDEKFVSTRNGATFDFVLGQGQVIRGWDDGLQYFNVGSQGYLYLPSGHAYGPGSVGPIPPNSILIFQVEVVSAN
jgi:FKBP-type peptidyl-prolyl cis-trans isomerase